MAHREEFLDVRGKKIQMLSGGSGEPLLYLHSAAGEVVWLPFSNSLPSTTPSMFPATRDSANLKDWIKSIV